MEDSVILTIAALLLIGYVVLYISGRKYLETFQGDRFNTDGSPKTRANSFQSMPENPSKEPRPDEYEISAVFQNQGSREASQQQISDAMTRYPLDWCARPPSDQLFQTKREGFTDQVSKEMTQAPVNDSQYDSVSGEAEQPEDTQQMDEDERKLLQTYKPESTKDLLHYSMMDAKQLARRLYKKKGLIPIIEPSKQGDNVFEIVEVKEIHPKIVWEDEVQNPEYRDNLRGEGIIEVPQVVNDTAAGLDPFFEPRATVRMDRHDYTKWTPGLERTFAPTYTGNGWA